MIGSENSHYPLKMKTTNNRDLIVSVFPRFKQFARFHFQFSLANGDDYLSFGFSDTRLETGLS